MSDPRWLRIEDEFEDACDYFRGAVRIFEKGILHGKDEAAWEAGMAFMHAMQSGHTSLESGLERILALLDEEHPGGPNWHADLLLQVARPVNERGPILPREVYAQADETRRFRNIAVRNYGSFRSEEATRVVAAAKVLIDSLNGCLRDFRAQIDPPEHDGGGDGAGDSMGGDHAEAWLAPTGTRPLAVSRPRRERWSRPALRLQRDRGIGLRSLKEAIDTDSSAGQLIFHIFGALAEFERALIRGRTQAGLKAARARGREGGRPKRLDEAQRAHAVELYRSRKDTVKELCALMGLSRATLYAYVNEFADGTDSSG